MVSDLAHAKVIKEKYHETSTSIRTSGQKKIQKKVTKKNIEMIITPRSFSKTMNSMQNLKRNQKTKPTHIIENYHKLKKKTEIKTKVVRPIHTSMKFSKNNPETSSEVKVKGHKRIKSAQSAISKLMKQTPLANQSNYPQNPSNFSTTVNKNYIFKHQRGHTANELDKVGMSKKMYKNQKQTLSPPDLSAQKKGASNINLYKSDFAPSFGQHSTT